MTSFGTKLRGNEKLAALTDKLQNGTAAYADAYEYALEVGAALSDTFGEELSSDVLPDGKMYFNIANRVVRDPLTRAYRLIADECEGVQKKLNTAAGIGLKAQRPDYPENRIKGFIDRLSSEPDYDKVSWMLKEPVKTFSESIVDDSVKKNAEMHYNAGLSPQIIRTAAAGCCEWCTAVEGKYRYPDVPKDIYRRHKFCRCQVEYDPRNGKRQDVHTRRWSDQEGYVRYRELKETNFESGQKQERERKIKFGPGENFSQKDRELIRTRQVITASNNIFIDNNLNFSKKEIRRIDKAISKAKSIHGIENDCNIPFVVTNNRGKIGSYNPVTDVCFVDVSIADPSKTIAIQRKEGYASPERHESTLVHELFHWKDAEEYRNAGNIINISDRSSPYIQYRIDVSEKALISLGLEMNSQDINRISHYAFEKWLDNDFDEVYTEYRTQKLLSWKNASDHSGKHQKTG